MELIKGHVEIKGDKFPVINIAGVDFYVDAIPQQLIELDNPSNIIKTKDLAWTGSHFEMVFDKESRTAKKPGFFSELYGTQYEYVWLRPLTVYDEEAARVLLEAGKPYLLKDLPVIDIEGVNFMWYRDAFSIQQQSCPWNEITPSDMRLHHDGVGFYFDTRQKVALFPHELERILLSGKLPQHIRFVHQQDIVRKINKQEQLKQEQTNRKGYRIR